MSNWSSVKQQFLHRNFMFESDHWSRRSLLMGTHAMWTQSSQLQQLIVSSWHFITHNTRILQNVRHFEKRLNEKNIPYFIRLQDYVVSLNIKRAQIYVFINKMRKNKPLKFLIKQVCYNNTACELIAITNGYLLTVKTNYYFVLIKGT